MIPLVPISVLNLWGHVKYFQNISSRALNAATLLWIVIMRPHTPNNGPLTARQLLFVRLYTKLLLLFIMVNFWTA